MAQPRGYIINKDIKEATGAHFNSKGHSVNDMEVVAIQKLYDKGAAYRKELEKEEIANFNTFHFGLNRNSRGC